MTKCYEVSMYFESYYSGELTNYTLYSKVFSDLKDAVSKFKNLSKNVEDIESWKKTRARIKDLKMVYPEPADFKDGYAKFKRPFYDEAVYFCMRELAYAYGFDYEAIHITISDPETHEITPRS